jgi:antitoxin VapB
MYIQNNQERKMQTTKLFQSGNSQAVRLPKEYQMPAREMYINKVGSALIILPKDDPWTLFNKSLAGFSADFRAGSRRQPRTPKHRFNFR